MTKHPQQLELNLSARIIRFPVRVVIDILRDLNAGPHWLAKSRAAIRAERKRKDRFMNLIARRQRDGR
jgi:hypothetical protein